MKKFTLVIAFYGLSLLFGYGLLVVASAKGCPASFESSLTGNFKAQVEQCSLNDTGKQE